MIFAYARHMNWDSPPPCSDLWAVLLGAVIALGVFSLVLWWYER
jgi:hypothetical protein